MTAPPSVLQPATAGGSEPAAPRPQREAVLICGMHRSGTSAASRAVSFLGYSQPQLLTKPGPANPRGFWQSTRIVELNEEMLASLGWSWDHTPLLTRPGLTPAEAEAEILAHLSAGWLERAREAIRTSFREDARRVVCKDPRLSLFPAFWQAAFEAEGFRVQHLLVFRDPDQVAASLHKQQQIGRAPALRSWLAYNLRPLVQVEVAATVDFADLVARPRHTVNTIGRALGVGQLDSAAAVELAEFIDRSAANAPELEEARLATPRLVAETLEVLREWRGPGQPRFDRRVEALRDAFADGQVLFGRVRRLPVLEAQAPAYRVDAPVHAPAVANTADRALVLHYHLFKNAGTSVDVVLEGNFGADFRNAEFQGRARKSNRDQVEAWIAEHPQVKAMSSQTARGPLPQIPHLAIAPVMFVRHPIDRIRSAYEFERRQKRNDAGAQLARRTDFSGYIETQLDRPGRQCRNFQTGRISAFEPGQGSESARARQVVETLPFIGLVEDFAGSMVRMESYLRQFFPAFRAFGAKANVWREGRTLEERLDDVRAELGPQLWRALVEANREDLELFALIAEKYRLPIDSVLPD